MSTPRQSAAAAASGSRRHTAWPDHVAIAAAYAVAAGVSWQRWTDPLVDFGRQLYVPWRLLEGDVLYRDVACIFGPLASYLNAALMVAFGVSMRTIELFNLALIASYALLLRAVFAALGGRPAGLLAAVAFLLLFAFPQYIFQANFNFVTPYCYDISYGLMIATLCVALLMRQLNGATSAWQSFGAGCCLGLVVLCKPELLLALLAAVAWTGIAQRMMDERPPQGLRIAFWSGAIGVFLAAVGAFLLVLPLRDAWRAAAGAWTPVLGTSIAGTSYYAWAAGTDEFGLNASRMLLTALPWGLALLVGRWLDRRVPLGRMTAWVTGTLLLLAVPLLLVRTLGQVWIVQHGVRSLPLLLAGSGLLLGARLLREHGAETRRQLACWLLLLVFALALLAKIPLAARFFHYGFALAAPAALVLLAMVIAPPRGLVAAESRMRWTQMALGSLLLTVVLAHLQSSLAHYAQRTYRLQDGPDAMTVFSPDRDPRGAYVQAFLAWSRTALPPTATLLVVPDGTMLGYLSRRDAGVRFYTLTQPELVAFGEQQVLDDYRANPPDFVAVLDQSNRLFGRFGDPGYGESIMAWLASAYRECARFGSTAPAKQEFGITVLARGGACPPGQPGAPAASATTTR